MKTRFTFRTWGYMLAFLFSVFAVGSLNAQRTPQAKCAGFTAKISNGSVLNLCTGTSISLKADPTVAGYTYQWQVQTTAGGPFVNISGATGTTYSASSLGAYRVFISTGACIDTSGITSLIRITPEGGKITPSTTKTICPGEPGGLITGTQVPGAELGIITFTWEKNENNTGFTTIQGATNVSYLAGAIMKTTIFRRVSNDNCGNKAYSNTVTLATTPDLLPGSVTPLTQTITAGSTPASITSATAASGGSSNFTYQWQSSLYERGPFSDIAGATSASYSPGALVQTTYYKRLVKDVRCFNVSEAPLAVVLVSNGILNAGTFTIYSSCVFPGGTPSPLQSAYPPTGGVAPYTVQWQSSFDNVNFTDIAGANGTTYQPATLTQTTYFRRKVTDAIGTIAYSNSESITLVDNVLTAGTIKATSNVACLGSNPAEIKSVTSPSGYAERLSFQWQYMNASSGGWKDIMNQIRESLIPDPITEKTSFRRATRDMCGNNSRTVYSNEVEIDIRPALLAGDIAPTSQLVHNGVTPKQITNVTSPSGGTGSYSLSWENADLAVGPWSTVAAATGLNYQPPVVTQSEYYRRVVMDKNCLATKYTYVVEVFLKKDTIVPCTLGGSQCVFPGNKPGVIAPTSTPTGGTAPYSYSWETKAITSPTWVVIAGATQMSYQPPVITQTTQYRQKVTDVYGTFAYTAPFTVEYHTAALNPGSIAVKTSPVICSGTTPGLIESVTPVSGYGENPTYQWQVLVGAGSWTNIAGANNETYQPGTITQTTYFRRAVTDMCGGATRTAYSNEVKFELPAAITLKAGLVDGPFITCAGTAPGMIKSVLEACSGSSVHYQWEVFQGGSWQSIAGATSASYTPGAITQNTQYRRKVTDDCSGSGYSNTVEIFVYPPIEPGIIGTASQTVCQNQVPEKIRLLTNCHYTDGTVTYQWQSASSAGGPWTDIAGQTTNEYQPAGGTASMYYRLTVKSTTCSFVAYTNVASVLVNATCSARTPLVAGRQDGARDMKVYPNPLTGNVIEVKLETKGSVNVRLMNSEGRAIPVTVSQTGSGLMKVSFNRVPSKGMYLLTVSDEKSTFTKKVIVE